MDVARATSGANKSDGRGHQGASSNRGPTARSSNTDAPAFDAPTPGSYVLLTASNRAAALCLIPRLSRSAVFLARATWLDAAYPAAGGLVAVRSATRWQTADVCRPQLAAASGSALPKPGTECDRTGFKGGKQPTRWRGWRQRCGCENQVCRAHAICHTSGDDTSANRASCGDDGRCLFHRRDGSSRLRHRRQASSPPR